MRQRKVKHEAERLAALQHRMMRTPEERDWMDGRDRRYLELGCGRGHFLAAKAEADPEGAYIGAEGRSSIVLRALELAEAKALDNLRCIPWFLSSLDEWFSPGELSGIYLNFSDPWPKARHAKRRLTHRDFMGSYRRALRPGGFIECKTDNDALFAFTLEEGEAAGLLLVEAVADLHRTGLAARETTTQYEHRFRLLGRPIHYCRFERPGADSEISMV